MRGRYRGEEEGKSREVKDNREKREAKERRKTRKRKGRAGKRVGREEGEARMAEKEQAST